MNKQIDKSNETISSPPQSDNAHLVSGASKTENNANKVNNTSNTKNLTQNPRISQYLPMKSTDILWKSEDLWGFHDEILQIFKQIN